MLSVKPRILAGAICATALSCLLAMPAGATLIGVSGPTSNMGAAAEIIAAPTDILDDNVTNTAMQGFDEAQGVETTVDHWIDGGGFIAAGTEVDSHMIFLNSFGTATLSHFSVQWTFDGEILGIMSDKNGILEGASTFELGAPGTNYTVGIGAAPFGNRGLEANDGVGDGPNDGYMLLDPYTLQVGMYVTEPGDWIRVITAHVDSVSVPESTTLSIFAFGLAGLAFSRRRMRAA